MRHRIFIAVNLPEDIKRKLIGYQKKIEELFNLHRNEVSGSGSIKWVKPENLHITLAFLGYLSNEELVEVLKITKEVILRHEPFLINLIRICYGPSKKMPPRMVWAEGEDSEELGKLHGDLENSLSASSVNGIETENRPYTPHITLGRIKQWEFRQIEPEERPEVNEEISLSFEVNSIEVMESFLKRIGPEYEVLESVELAK